MGKILVVDDQAGVRRLLVDILKEDQHEVEVAASGVKALQLFDNFEPDLILMDMKMPGMNGIETLSQIRALNRHMAVIMMTAYGGPEAMKQVKDLGILYYMDKPFDLFKLRERVKEILFNSSGIIAEGLTS